MQEKQTNFQETNNQRDFIKAAENSVEYKELLFRKLLEDTTFLNKIIKNQYSFIDIARKFPDFKESLFKKLLEDAEFLDKELKQTHTFIDIVNMFPELKALLFKKLSDETFLNVVTKEGRDFIDIIKTFPELKALLFKKIPDETFLNEVIKGGRDFIDIVNIFPELKESLLKKLLEDTAFFKKVINEVYSFPIIENTFPGSFHQLFSRIPEVPELADKIMKKTKTDLGATFPLACTANTLMLYLNKIGKLENNELTSFKELEIYTQIWDKPFGEANLERVQIYLKNTYNIDFKIYYSATTEELLKNDIYRDRYTQETATILKTRINDFNDSLFLNSNHVLLFTIVSIVTNSLHTVLISKINLENYKYEYRDGHNVKRFNNITELNLGASYTGLYAVPYIQNQPTHNVFFKSSTAQLNMMQDEFSSTARIKI